MEIESIYIKKINDAKFVYAINKDFSMITSFTDKYPFSISNFYENNDSNFILMPKFKDILVDFKKPICNTLNYNEKIKSIEFNHDFLNQDDKDMINIVLDHAYSINSDKDNILIKDLQISSNKGLEYIKKYFKR